MATPNFSALLPDIALNELNELTKALGINRTQVVIRAIHNLHQQEIKTMKQIKVGTTNDLHLYAVEADGRYYPLTKSDLNFESPDAKIFYDSGIYPGITLEELPQYICDKAKAM